MAGREVETAAGDQLSPRANYTFPSLYQHAYIAAMITWGEKDLRAALVARDDACTKSQRSNTRRSAERALERLEVAAKEWAVDRERINAARARSSS